MKFEITTEILINAPIDIVWKTLTNFEDYKNWNPFIIDVSGEIHKGGKIIEINVPLSRLPYFELIQ